jgi:hypothetical protein
VAVLLLLLLLLLAAELGAISPPKTPPAGEPALPVMAAAAVL